MSYTQHYIVEGKPLGSSPRGPTLVHATLAAPDSYAYFCPICAEVWARAPTISPSGKVSRFTVWTLACRKHHDTERLSVSGSLLLPWDNTYNEALFTSDAALRWEFQVHMEAVCSLPS